MAMFSGKYKAFGQFVNGTVFLKHIQPKMLNGSQPAGINKYFLGAITIFY